VEKTFYGSKLHLEAYHATVLIGGQMAPTLHSFFKGHPHHHCSFQTLEQEEIFKLFCSHNVSGDTSQFSE
jgi:hypothetical protein